MVDSEIVVVTGTDTEIGKTLVGAGLSANLRRRGVDIRSLKPVESGAEDHEPCRRDGAVLADAAGQPEPLHAFVELGRPLAPPEAADIDGVELDMAAWCDQIRSHAEHADRTIVEGAGGVLSPLTWEETARDLAGRLEAPALVVVPDELGVLNHTLMTLEVLRNSGVSILGVVFSRADPRADASTGRNPRTLRQFWEVDRIATLPPVDGPEEAADELDEVADWWLDGGAP
ncbi:MAG: dethiobiotin synthase [Bradymonadaceae bacterium]